MYSSNVANVGDKDNDFYPVAKQHLFSQIMCYSKKWFFKVYHLTCSHRGGDAVVVELN